ncbi:MAG: hypothetical protein ACRDLL_09620 [Solirubrobacterales bacterium]
MRLIKMLGFAGATALIAMAVVGTGAASADTACLEDPPGGAQGECQVGWRGPIIGLAIPASFSINGKLIKCRSSEFLADWNKNEGKKVGDAYLILSLSFIECGECIVKAENLSWLLLVLVATQEHAFISEDPSFGRPSLLFENCNIGGVKLNCLYENADATLINYILETKENEKGVKVPLAGALAWNAQLFWAGGDKLCAKEAGIEATYLIYEDVSKKDGPELFFTAIP